MLAFLRTYRRLLVPLALLAALAVPASTLAATIYGTSGDDTLYGTSSEDTMYGLAGDDAMYGRGGPDMMYGGDDHDMLAGGYGDDWLYGGRRGDALMAGRGSDHLYGGYGNDRIYASGDDMADMIRCGPGEDYVWYGPSDMFPDSSCEHLYLQPS